MLLFQLCQNCARDWLYGLALGDEAGRYAPFRGLEEVTLHTLGSNSMIDRAAKTSQQFF
jgi:hypothetical protein